MINMVMLDDKKKQLEVVLQNIISDIAHKDLLIHTITSYVMFPAGKRLRPLLTLFIYEMLGGIKGNIYACACITEMIHVATLMLDDLPCMDDSAYRRNKLSCHKKFGDAQTILVAFGLAAESFHILSDKNNFDGVADEKMGIMIHEVTQKIGFSGLVGGQVADLNRGKTVSGQINDEEKLNYITNNKTAVLFEVCALIACCLADATLQDKKQMMIYAHNLGFALQIMDDLHDSNEDKGLSFVKIYGVNKTKELLQQKIQICCDSIMYANEYAELLKQLPQILLENVI